jgi:spore photoproduct lyase
MQYLEPWRRFEHLFIEEDSLQDELTWRVRRRLPHLPVEIIPNKEALLHQATHSAADIKRGKRTLLLARQKGQFWRSCPGTKNYLCCGYQVLQVMTNCPLDCSYCVLQGYLNVPAVTLFTNIDDLLAELETRLASDEQRVWRLGTGEFGDSLALDGLIGLNQRLIPFFAGQPRALLEIKTKYHDVEPLLSFGPNPRVIFAWSLNTRRIIRGEEHFSLPLRLRLQAARRCAEAGFRLAFHFDPIIYYPGWAQDYQQVVAELLAAVPAPAIAWISLGCLRFMPEMKNIIRQRFPASRLAEEEFITALDGKKRYFKSLRIELYAAILEWLRAGAPDVLVYLCMESPAVWEKVFGFTPKEGELANWLDEKVYP